MSYLAAIHDRVALAAYLRASDPYLHTYALGDLDDFFWPQTQWFGLYEGEALQAVALFYLGAAIPTLLLLHHDPDELHALTSRLLPYLPRHMYLHISPGIHELLEEHYQLTDGGEHFKLGLMDASTLSQVMDTAQVQPLSPADIDAIQALYAASYPGNWFDARMLETGQYMGIWEGDRLLSIAGIHVYSPAFRVAALGNITTLPRARGRGLARLTTAALCQQMQPSIEVMTLNVKADNTPALRMYERLGFTKIARYWEYDAVLR